MFDRSPYETKSDMGKSHRINCQAKPLIDPSSIATLYINNNNLKNQLLSFHIFHKFHMHLLVVINLLTYLIIVYT